MMKLTLKNAYLHEMNQAKDLYAKTDYEAGFYHLERAHILAQAHYIPHLKSHYWMLKVGFKKKDLKEILGQLLRIIGSSGSLIGKYPLGNTGGANVSAIKPMPIPQDLQKIIDQS